MNYRKNKTRNLGQIGILSQSQEFMPEIARGFVYFVFRFIKLNQMPQTDFFFLTFIFISFIDIE